MGSKRIAAVGRTAAERRTDDRDSVMSNIENLGLYCAMRWAQGQLSAVAIPPPRKRRMLVLTIRECARRLAADVANARRLAAAHTIGMRNLGIRVGRCR